MSQTSWAVVFALSVTHLVGWVGLFSFLTCFFSSTKSRIVGSTCFSSSAPGDSTASDFSLVLLFLFSFFLSFSCLSFLSDLSLRCLRFDSLPSFFWRRNVILQVISPQGEMWQQGGSKVEAKWGWGEREVETKWEYRKVGARWRKGGRKVGVGGSKAGPRREL